jgi:hypothetical protein
MSKRKWFWVLKTALVVAIYLIGNFISESYLAGWIFGIIAVVVNYEMTVSETKKEAEQRRKTNYYKWEELTDEAKETFTKLESQLKK